MLLRIESKEASEGANTIPSTYTNFYLFHKQIEETMQPRKNMKPKAPDIAKASH